MTTSRRQVLLTAAGLGTAAWFAGRVRPAAADLLLDPDPVQAYEKAFARVDTSVRDNEAGWLAWGVSYLLESLVRMYQATGNIAYLDRFVERADATWALTDVNRGVTDWSGRSGWVWRTGGSYTAAGVAVPDAAGEPLFEIRYASATPSTATVTVQNPSAGRCDLVLTHPTTGTLTLTGVSLDPASADDVVDRVNTQAYGLSRRWTAKRLGGAATATPLAGVRSLQQRYYAFAVHTGMVTYPMAMFARMVLEGARAGDHTLVRYVGAAQRYLTWTRKAVAFHDREWRWRTLPDGSTGGDYVWPKGAPVPFDGLVQPFNQTQGLGQTMAELHRLDASAAYAAKVQAMVRAFRGDMEVDGAAWQWHYWPTYSELFNSYPASANLSEYTPWYGRASQYEDISHAAISVEFMVAAHRAGLGTATTDLDRLAHTYLDNIRNGDTGVFTRVDGTTPAVDSNAAQAGRWLALEPWGPGMAAHVTAVYDAMVLEPSQNSHLLGIGYLAWAAAQGWLQD